MTNHCNNYGPNREFSSFRELVRRSSLPRVVRDYLKFTYGYSSMSDFCSYGTRKLIEEGEENRHFTRDQALAAVDVWVRARDNRPDLALPASHSPPTEEEEPMDNPVNADRNEMIALLQGAKGAQFVQVQQCYSRVRDDEEGKTHRKGGPTLTYKAVDLDLKEGDTVVVQYRDRFGIAVVTKVMTEAPTSDEYDYSVKLKHVVQKIDTHRSTQLEELDRQMLRKITASEASDRLERLTRQLGIELDKITLTLPDVDNV